MSHRNATPEFNPEREVCPNCGVELTSSSPPSGNYLYCIPIEEFSKAQLIKVILQLAKEEQSTLKEHAQDLDNFGGI